MLRLLVKDAVGNLFEYPLDFEQLVLGRDDDCNVILDAPDVSRKHARFFFDEAGYLLVEDMGSASGTIVDGHAIAAPVAIDENSRVLVGSFILFLQNIEDEELEDYDGYDDDDDDEGPRLVVLDGADRGAEYHLGAPEITIGRAGSNLIVLEHASVSPEHAQILQEGEAFVLQDLASNSGSRVNGREIDDVALRDGDVIQLGALRFRFTFGREVTRRRAVAKLTMEIRSRWRILVPGAAAMLLLIVLIALLAGSGGSENDEVAPIPENDEPTAQARLLAARTAMEQGQWNEAGQALEIVLAEDPLNDKATELKRQVARERGLEKTYNEAVMLFEIGRKGEAKRVFSKIPTDSFYHQQARPKIQELNEHLAREYYEIGYRAYRRERFRSAHEILVRYMEIRPEDQKVARWVRDCEEKLTKMRVKFSPWEAPTSGDAGPEISFDHQPQKLRTAYRRYYGGDIDEALKRLERLIARKKVKGADLDAARRTRQLMLVVRGKHTSGQTAFFRRDMEEAKREWDAALEADRELVPEGGVSHFAREIATNLARGYIDLAQDALAKELFEKAFGLYQKATAVESDNVMAKRGMLKLERVARRLLGEAQEALAAEDKLKAERTARRAVAITRPDAELHQQAKTFLEEL